MSPFAPHTPSAVLAWMQCPHIGDGNEVPTDKAVCKACDEDHRDSRTSSTANSGHDGVSTERDTLEHCKGDSLAGSSSDTAVKASATSLLLNDLDFLLAGGEGPQSITSQGSSYQPGVKATSQASKCGPASTTGIEVTSRKEKGKGQWSRKEPKHLRDPWHDTRRLKPPALRETKNPPHSPLPKAAPTESLTKPTSPQVGQSASPPAQTSNRWDEDPAGPS